MADNGRHGDGCQPPTAKVEDPGGDGDGNETFEGVGNPDEEAGFDADDAEDVAGADVAAAILADVVNALGASYEQADRGASEEVGADYCDDGDELLAQRSSSSRRRARTSSLIGVPVKSYSLRRTFTR